MASYQSEISFTYPSSSWNIITVVTLVGLLDRDKHTAQRHGRFDQNGPSTDVPDYDAQGQSAALHQVRSSSVQRCSAGRR
jgi:hypothetical protein